MAAWGGGGGLDNMCERGNHNVAWKEGKEGKGREGTAREGKGRQGKIRSVGNVLKIPKPKL